MKLETKALTPRSIEEERVRLEMKAPTALYLGERATLEPGNQRADRALFR